MEVFVLVNNNTIVVAPDHSIRLFGSDIDELTLAYG
jgi:hypothetical protein